MIETTTAPLSASDLVLCDFDGTISRIDTGLHIAETLKLDKFMEIEMIWRDGKISSRECMARQWRTVDPSNETFQRIIATAEPNPGFQDLVRLTRARGSRFIVLSDGLDFYIETMLERLGMDDIEFRANHAIMHEHHIEMTFPHGAHECEHCGNCKTKWLFELRPGFERTVYIGDGFSDACASAYCDVVFAKDSLERLCRERDQEYFPFDTLHDVVNVLNDGV